MYTQRRLLLKATATVVLGVIALASPPRVRAASQLQPCGICVSTSRLWQCSDPAGYFNAECQVHCSGLVNNITCAAPAGLSCGEGEFAVSCADDDMRPAP